MLIWLKICYIVVKICGSSFIVKVKLSETDKEVLFKIRETEFGVISC